MVELVADAEIVGEVGRTDKQHIDAIDRGNGRRVGHGLGCLQLGDGHDAFVGVIFGALAAIGQGVGAVLSRKGFGLAAAAGVPVDGLSAAFPRVVGGFAITLLWYVLHHQIQRWRVVEAGPAPVSPRPSHYLWVLAHGLAGPVLGMGTFQMALATVPSGIVLPITATTPLMVIPFAYWLEGERPSKRSLVGGVIAVAGAVALTLQ